MSRDPRVDDYIAKAEPFAQPILEHLRVMMARLVPQGDEAIKWGAPHWILGGRNLAGMASFKAHARIFLHGAMNADEETTWSRFGKLKSVSDCPDEDELKRILAPRIAILESGKALTKASGEKPELPVPVELASALDQSPKARQAFEAFSPSHRREYIEWITSAKRDETRAKRVSQTIMWLTEGKKRNWKYENC